MGSGAVAQYLADQGYLDASSDVRQNFLMRWKVGKILYRHGPQIVPEGQKNNRVVITYMVKPGKRYYLRSCALCMIQK